MVVVVVPRLNFQDFLCDRRDGSVTWKEARETTLWARDLALGPGLTETKVHLGAN